MKSKIKLFGMYLPIFALALVASVVLRTIACINDLNLQSTHFDDKILNICANVIVALATVYFITYVFKKGKDMKFIPNFTSASTYVPTGLVGVATVFMIVFLFSTAKTEYNTINIYGEYPLRGMAYFHFAAAFFALLSIVHFVLTALIERHSSTSRATFGLCTVIFLSLYSVHLYFDSSMPVNAPNKLIDELSYLSSALFFLYETRLSMGREKWKEYISIGFISALFTAYSSIPALITFFVRDAKISNNIYESVLTLALFIFISSRILLTSKLIENEQSAVVNSISNFAREREENIAKNDLNYAVATKCSEEESEENISCETAEEENSLQITIDEIIEDAEDQSTTEGKSEEATTDHSESDGAISSGEESEATDEESIGDSKSEESAEASDETASLSEEKTDDIIDIYSNEEDAKDEEE